MEVDTPRGLGRTYTDAEAGMEMTELNEEEQEEGTGEKEDSVQFHVGVEEEGGDTGDGSTAGYYGVVPDSTPRSPVRSK